MPKTPRPEYREPKDTLETQIIQCRGIDLNCKQPLKKSKAETIILMIYKDGTTIPMCRYITGAETNICSASTDYSHTEQNYTFCPYRLRTRE